MFWKIARYQKKEGEQFAPCVHNTFGIPDAMVMASLSDVPVVEMTYNYASPEERLIGEVLAVIGCMNKQGKFVSKHWISEKLNFKSRKADDIIAELKREGKINEVVCIRNAHKHGSYYKLAGHKWKRTIQLAHARLRRDIRAARAANKESFNSPKKGAQHSEVPFSESSSETGLVVNKEEESLAASNGFSKLKRESKKSAGPKRHYDDGTPGDGRSGTCYSANGCFARLTNPDFTYEYGLIEDLLLVSRNALLCPAVARSAARRIDSGLISPETVTKIKNVITEKSYCYDIRDIILNFEQILKENTETIHPDELWHIEQNINSAIDGTDKTKFNKDVKAALDVFTPTYNADPKYINTPFEKLLKLFNAPYIPHYAKLVAAYSCRVPDELLKKLLNEFKQSIYKSIAGNKTIYEFLKNKLNLTFIDWNEIDAFKQAMLEDIKCTLYVNKLSNTKLDTYYRKIHFPYKVYATGCEQLAGAGVGHGTEISQNACGVAE